MNCGISINRIVLSSQEGTNTPQVDGDFYFATTNTECRGKSKTVRESTVLTAWRGPENFPR